MFYLYIFYLSRKHELYLRTLAVLPWLVFLNFGKRPERISIDGQNPGDDTNYFEINLLRVEVEITPCFEGLSSTMQ